MNLDLYPKIDTYPGFSCEKCNYGYTRVGGKLFEGECRKCDCNGHAATCDQNDFKCDVSL